jgi:hypothetical protein
MKEGWLWMDVCVCQWCRAVPSGGGGEGGDGIRFGNDHLCTGLGICLDRDDRVGPRHKPKAMPFRGVLMSLYLTKLRLATFTEHARAESGV